VPGNGEGRAPRQRPGPATTITATNGTASLLDGMTALEWALAYERHGLSVAPAPVVGKRALVRWRPWQQTRPDPDQLRIWWRRWPKANVAIICGRISDLVVVDIDPAHGGLGTLAAMEIDHQLLDRSATVLTPSGGRHYWFRHPGGRLSNSNKAIRDRYGAGVDIRGDGGLVLAPPSVRLTGAYRWRVGGPATIPPIPGWLVELLRPRPAERRRVETHGAPTTGRLAGLERQVRNATEGNRNQMLYWAGCRLREMGAPKDWAEALEQAAVDAGLSRSEASGTLTSALGRADS
jgi:Bifunctional DNA primase/polymerase, N-terminal